MTNLRPYSSAEWSADVGFCCVRYLSLQILDGIPSDVSVPIWSLDANAVLAQERAAFAPLVPAV
jgi:hypothetical protein